MLFCLFYIYFTLPNSIFLKLSKKKKIYPFEIKNNFLVRVKILPVVLMKSINRFFDQSKHLIATTAYEESGVQDT